MRKKLGLYTVFILLMSIVILLFIQNNKIQKNTSTSSSNIVKNNNILNRSYKTINVTISKHDDPTQEIQDALNIAKHSNTPIKVIVPEGRYTLTRALHIYSNTWLYTSANTVFQKSNTHKEIMLLNGDFNQNYYKYNGNSNIVIDGGIWDAGGANFSLKTPSVFGIAHGQNIIIQHTIIKNIVGGHAIDCAGNKNVEIRNNKFLGFHQSSNEDYIEAIQIDGMISDKAFRRFGSVDSTVSQNIKINNNYFGNSHVKGMEAWAVGVGSHSAGYKKPYSNLTITNNTFENMSYAGIRVHNWKNTIIENNIFRNCNQGIQVDSSGFYYFDHTNVQSKGKLVISNINIKKNQFININNSEIALYGNYSDYNNNIITNNNSFINTEGSPK